MSDEAVVPQAGDRPVYGVSWTSEEEASHVEAALDAILDALIASEAARARQPLKTTSWRQIMEEPLPTRRQGLILDLAKDPVRTALRHQVKLLGERLFDLGGLPLMEAVCERVEAKDERQGGRKAETLDRRWSGIGDERGMWWA